jgi:hypothetical protein
LSSRPLSKNLKIRIYKTIILPLAVYGCETWSLTLREKCKLRVFENRVLRRISGSQRDGVGGGWSKLHNDELHDLYSSASVIKISTSKRIMWAGYAARKGEKRNVYRVLVGKPEVKKPLGRPRRRWMDSIKLELVGIERGGVDWIGLPQDSYR